MKWFPFSVGVLTIALHLCRQMNDATATYFLASSCFVLLIIREFAPKQEAK